MGLTSMAPVRSSNPVDLSHPLFFSLTGGDKDDTAPNSHAELESGETENWITAQHMIL